MSAALELGVRATPMAISRMPSAAINARRMLCDIRLDLDRRDLADDQVPDEDQEDRKADHGPADEVLGHRLEVGRRHEVEEDREADRQDRDQGAGRGGLRGQGLDLALDPYPLADGVRYL